MFNKLFGHREHRLSGRNASVASPEDNLEEDWDSKSFINGNDELEEKVARLREQLGRSENIRMVQMRNLHEQEAENRSLKNRIRQKGEGSPLPFEELIEKLQRDPNFQNWLDEILGNNRDLDALRALSDELKALQESFDQNKCLSIEEQKNLMSLSKAKIKENDALTKQVESLQQEILDNKTTALQEKEVLENQVSTLASEKKFSAENLINEIQRLSEENQSLKTALEEKNTPNLFNHKLLESVIKKLSKLVANLELELNPDECRTLSQEISEDTLPPISEENPYSSVQAFLCEIENRFEILTHNNQNQRLKSNKEIERLQEEMERLQEDLVDREENYNEHIEEMKLSSSSLKEVLETKQLLLDESSAKERAEANENQRNLEEIKLLRKNIASFQEELKTLELQNSEFSQLNQKLAVSLHESRKKLEHLTGCEERLRELKQTHERLLADFSSIKAHLIRYTKGLEIPEKLKKEMDRLRKNAEEANIVAHNTGATLQAERKVNLRSKQEKENLAKENVAFQEQVVTLKQENADFRDSLLVFRDFIKIQPPDVQSRFNTFCSEHFPLKR